MRAIFASDLHAHTWRPYASVDSKGRNTRLMDLIDVVGQIVDMAVERKVSDVFVGGDVFHVKRHVPVQAAVLMYEAFANGKDRGVTWHIIPGNHDTVVGDTGAETTPLILQDVARVYQGPQVDKSRRFVFVPWGDQEKVKLFLKDLRGEWDLLLYHGETDGAYVGPTDYPLPLSSRISLKDLRPEIFRLVMMGHLHRRQRVGGSKSNAWYIGNPLPKDAGEREVDKGVIFVDGDEMKILQTRHPTFVSVDVTTTEDWKKTKGNYVLYTVPHDFTDSALEKLVGATEPKAFDVRRAAKLIDRTGKRDTTMRLGLTIEEMIDGWVEEVAGDAAAEEKQRLKDAGRRYAKTSAIEGRDH